jgi:DNA-binding transcriptional MerR regulator
LAARLGVTARTIRNWERRAQMTGRYATGAGRGHKVLYCEDEVQRWLARLGKR